MTTEDVDGVDKVLELLEAKCLETERDTGPGTAKLVWLTVDEVAAGTQMNAADSQAALDKGVEEELVLKGTGENEGKYALNDPDLDTKYEAV